MSQEKKRILIVDDEAIIAMAVAETLQKEGYKTILAHKGQEAIDSVKALGGAVDLILMDVDLGSGMDGTQAAVEILRHHDIPVVFVTGHIEPEVVAKTEKITSYGYVVKNSGDTVLIASIKMAFKLFEANLRLREEELVLRESEAKHRQLFEVISDPLFLVENETGQILEVNQAVETFYGYSRGELLSMKNTVLSAEPEKTREATIGGGTRIPVRWHKKKDGSTFPVEITARHFTFMGKAVHIAAIRDVSQRLQTEEVLLDSFMRIQDTLESISDGFLSLDNRQVVNYFNRAAERIFGRPREEILGKPFCDVFPQARNSLFEEKIIWALKEKRPVVFETEYGTPPNLNWFDVRIASQREGISIYLQEISERKRAEEALRKALTEKDLLMKELQHRVKNNLGVISSLLAMAESRSTHESVKKAFIDAQNRIRSMMEVYDQLSRTADVLRINLGDYLEDLVHTLFETYVIDPKNVALDARLEPMRLEIKRAVPLGLILNELLSNALKYAFPGDRQGRIAVVLKKEQEAVVLEVTDDGVGLPPGFDILKSKHMGMNLVQLLTAQLNGAIAVQGQGGSSFCIRFPLHTGTPENGDEKG